jgi:hypothetical protein
VSDESADPFSEARNSVRETMKWLIAALAGLAALVVGTSSLTNLGALSWGPRLVVAIESSVAGLGLILYGIKIALDVLLVSPFFLKNLVDDDKKLSNYINTHADDVLPHEYKTLKAFYDARNAKRDIYWDKKQPEKDRNEAGDYLKRVQPFVALILGLAALEQLRTNFMTARTKLLTIAVLAFVCLGIFAWAANPPKEEPSPKLLQPGQYGQM